tara:strand:- start:5401 stop:6150 length:750 start_codon:yes stop_codon:yes gene_type:complete
MTIIDRQKLIAEELIREHVRKRISDKIEYDRLCENKLRTVIRRLVETETGTDEASNSTGINVLASLLEKIIPAIEESYTMLTTSPEQRESFRNHIIHAIKNTLKPIEAAAGANLPENFEFDIDKEYLTEKMLVDLTPEEDEVEDVEGEFIDIEGDEGEEEFIQLDDQNETGRNFAATAFKQVEKQIVDAYDMLADEEDQQLFYDYLITNMLLYFDKFEDSLTAELPAATTPEYEKEKEETEAESTIEEI